MVAAGLSLSLLKINQLFSLKKGCTTREGVKLSGIKVHRCSMPSESFLASWKNSQ